MCIRSEELSDILVNLLTQFNIQQDIDFPNKFEFCIKEMREPLQQRDQKELHVKSGRVHIFFYKHTLFSAQPGRA